LQARERKEKIRHRPISVDSNIFLLARFRIVSFRGGKWG